VDNAKLVHQPASGGMRIALGPVDKRFYTDIFALIPSKTMAGFVAIARHYGTGLIRRWMKERHPPYVGWTTRSLSTDRPGGTRIAVARWPSAHAWPSSPSP